MNLSDRMIFDKIKRNWENGGRLTDDDTMNLMDIIYRLDAELKHYKTDHELIFGKSRTGGKIQNSSLYGKMGDKL